MGLSPLTYLGFATPGFFMALTAIPTYLTLQKFYVDTVGLAAGTVALVLALSRFIDALTDPLIGWLSDRISSPFGRRKPFMLLGGIVCGASLWPLLQPSGSVSATYLFAWISLFYLGAALIQIPYTAWTADLTKDYAARTRLASAGQLALLIGTVVALVAPIFSTEIEMQLRILTYLAFAALPLSLLPALILVREPREEVSRPGHPFEALRLVFDVAGMARFGLAYALNAIGNTLPLTLSLFYFDYVLEIDPGAPLLLYFGMAIALIPLWSFLGNRWGRERAWVWALTLTPLFQLPAAFLGMETAGLFFITAALTGACLAADFTLPQAIQADLADQDAQARGADRAATHYAFWSLTINIATALGAALALSLIGWSGFVPGPSLGEGAATQPTSAIWAIALTYGALPLAFKGSAAWLIRASSKS